jgi:hypothetical protein
MAASSLPLFPAGGVHWNSYGAYLVASNVLDRAGQFLKKPLVKVRCTGIPVGREPRWTDSECDAKDLLNIWRPVAGTWLYPRPRFEQETCPGAVSPDILIIGDSFANLFINVLQNVKVCRNVGFWYYARTGAESPGDSKQDGQPAIDWDKELFQRDIVLVLCNEIQLDTEAWGFVDNALKHIGDTK